MSESKIRTSMQNLGNALNRLDEALQEPINNSLIIDGTIQRFEFTLEMFWKTLKRLLEHEGTIAQTPRDTLQKAYAAGWLQDEASWLQMLSDRNKTSHVYDETQAKVIYEHIKKNYPELSRTYQDLQQRFSQHL